jgi:serine/threonine protein kinase
VGSTSVRDPATLVRGTQSAPTTGRAESTELRGDDASLPGGTGELRVGTIVHDWYRLESLIGRGAMGQVWKALDLQRQRAGDPQPYVALKLIGYDFAEHLHAKVALEREASKAQQLAHPNIATVFVFAEDPSTQQSYLAMELLEGQPLDRLIVEHAGGVPRERALGIVRGLASGLAYAHAKGIVHCDFKPGNAFVTDTGVAKVLDFGIARLAREVARSRDSFDAGEALGALTPSYASLEMLEGVAPHPADDVYALGLVAYELLSGRHPFGRKTAAEALERGLKPAPLKGVRRREWRAIERALTLTRADRWPDAASFLKALEGLGPWLPALVGLAATLVVVAGIAGYQNYRASLPDVPFEQLQPEEQAAFREAMMQGDDAYNDAINELDGFDALLTVYEAALSNYARAYALHPKNPEADAALRRSIEFLSKHVEDTDLSVRQDVLGVLEDYRAQNAALADYRPLERLIEQLK